MTPAMISFLQHFPFDSRFRHVRKLGRKIRKSFISSQLPRYHFDLLETIDRTHSLRNKTVIDIGGSNIPADLMKLYGVKKFVCLDPITKWGHPIVNGQCQGKTVIRANQFQAALKDHYSFVLDCDIEEIQDEMDGLFDLVLSISTFEHVTSLHQTLDVIFRILKTGGVIISQYEPVFSCGVGHHVWIDDQYNFTTMPELDFMHLLYNREEAKSYLESLKRFDAELIDRVLTQSYDSRIINRFTLNDHLNSFTHSKFNSYSIEYFCFHPVPDHIVDILRQKHGDIRFDVRGIKFTATKQIS